MKINEQHAQQRAIAATLKLLKSQGYRDIRAQENEDAFVCVDPKEDILVFVSIEPTSIESVGHPTLAEKRESALAYINANCRELHNVAVRFDTSRVSLGNNSSCCIRYEMGNFVDKFERSNS